MLSKNNYKADKPKTIIFIIACVLATYIFIKSFDFENLAATEIQEFQSKIITFSSPYQLYDQGGIKSIDRGDVNIFSDQFSIKDLSLFSKNLFAAILNAFSNENSTLDEISLFIKFKNLEKINSDRKAALSLGINKDPITVPCKISDGINIFKCNVRLKGDLIDHWSSETRMSLRIKIKDGFIYGMKEFALQKPAVRQFPYDQTFHKLNAGMGRLSSNQQEFFRVTLNNNSWGVMNVEPIVDQRFLEKNNLKRTGVFRISNQDSWAYSRKEFAYDKYFLSDPTIHLNLRGNESKLFLDQNNFEVFSYIFNGLSNKNGEIFDRPKMISNLVFSLVWGSLHPLYNSNAWYTWHPYTLKLEPILTDQSKWFDIKDQINLIESIPFEYKLLFRQAPLSFEEFNKEILMIDNFISSNNPIDIANKFKRSYFPNDSTFEESNLQENLLYLKNNIESIISIINNLSIKKENLSEDISPLKNEFLETISDYVRVFHFTDGTIKIFNLIDKEVLVESIKIDNRLINVGKTISASSSEDLKSLELKTNLTGNKSRKIAVNAYHNSHLKTSYNELSLLNFDSLIHPENIDISSTNLCTARSNEEFCVLSGIHYFDKPLSFHQKVIVRAGTQIFLNKGVDLIFNKSVVFEGSNKNPINVSGNNTGGIFIFNRESDESILKNVNFSFLSTLTSPLRKYTGSVNGYGGTFILENVKVKDSVAEDQLNINNAIVNISNLAISNSPSDAFDCDFCNGAIDGLTLLNIGGDGLDISGSNLEAKNIKASSINDKAVSIGEKSFINISNLIIDDVSTGVAAKDSSQANVDNIKISNIRHDVFMTYIKKPFFRGKTNLIVTNVLGEDQKNLCVREKNTSLSIDGELCEISEINVDELYAGRMKK